jgi:hypothetical protein
MLGLAGTPGKGTNYLCHNAEGVTGIGNFINNPPTFPKFLRYYFPNSMFSNR